MKAAEGMIRGKNILKTGFSEGKVFSNAVVMYTHNIRLLVMGLWITGTFCL